MDLDRALVIQPGDLSTTGIVRGGDSIAPNDSVLEFSMNNLQNTTPLDAFEFITIKDQMFASTTPTVEEIIS